MRGRYQDRSGQKIRRDAGRRAAGAAGLDLGRGVGVEDRVEQAEEAAVDVLLAFTFTAMSILGPAAVGPIRARSITFGAGLAALGTIAMAVTGCVTAGT